MAPSAKLGPTRNLHWVFKVADRTATSEFYGMLGMTTLRHEEFEAGCDAACNGPYDGKWSKTMIGYGPEDTHFVLELTYNYDVKKYELGNDFRHIIIRHKGAYQALQAKSFGEATQLPDGAAAFKVTTPDGYPFLVAEQEATDSPCSSPMTELALHVTDLKKSLEYWSDFLGFTQLPSSSQAGAQQQHGGEVPQAVLSCGKGETVLRLVELPKDQLPLDRGTAFGRVAFSTPGGLLEQLEADVKAAGYTVHTPYKSLDTPGKATVQVVILQDPDGHEICFVGTEAFTELSQPDPEAPRLLAEAAENDKSKEWIAKREKREAEMKAKGV